MGFLNSQIIKKEIKRSIFTIIIFFIILFLFLDKSIISGLENSFVFDTEQHYQGIVEDKYYDKKNHNSAMLKFKNKNERLAINYQIWKMVEVGDSLNKVKGDSITEIFRNNEKIEFNIAPMYKEMIEGAKKRQQKKFNQISLTR